ncbi:hypothetical protein GGF32_009767 [Allomyces javanicus]|nr:hypothetical protein GGF32_009767 [Allomyces javanicus]
MSRVAEFESHRHAALKAITKPRFGFFWKPDPETAAQEFERAATIVKTERPDLAMTSFLDSAECWIKADSTYMAAKAFETAAQLATTPAVNDPARAATLYHRASECFVLNGTPDRAAEALEKAAKAADAAGQVPQALAHWDECITLYQDEERYRIAVDAIKRAVAFAASRNLMDSVLHFLDLQRTAYAKITNANGLSKAVLSLIIVHLAINDGVRASQLFEQAVADTQLARDELHLASSLLDAMDRGDPDALQAATSAQLITFLDAPIVRIARKLETHGPMGGIGGSAAPPPPVPGFVPAAVPLPPTPVAGAPIPGFAAPTPTVPAPAPIPGFAPPPVAAAAPIPGFAGAAPAAPAPAPIPGFGPAATPAPAIPGFGPPPAASGPAPAIPGFGPGTPLPPPVPARPAEEEDGDDFL